jgi:ATP-dependent DNA ligase
MIFDILVFDNEHLIGKTFKERLEILHDMLDFVDENDYCYKITDNIYLTKTFYTGFGEIWDKFVKIDMLEGLVLKRKDAGLEPGTVENNNVMSQLKCRKSTKNYNH